MESTSTAIEAEIKSKALDHGKLLFSHGFDPEDFDKYMRLLIQMKVNLDNLNEGKQREPKELAILYKRFKHNV